MAQSAQQPSQQEPLEQLATVQPQPLEVTIPLAEGLFVPRCDTPCPCCFYTLSSVVHGRFSMGWRKFGGHWSWWHRDGPHGFVNRNDVSLGIHAPDTPACACCYYRVQAPGSSGPGWFVDDNQRWRWSEENAPHAPGVAWHLQGDDARYMIGLPSLGNQGPVHERIMMDLHEREYNNWVQLEEPM